MQDQGFSSLISKVIDTKYYKKVSLGTRTDFFCATLRAVYMAKQTSAPPV